MPRQPEERQEVESGGEAGVNIQFGNMGHMRIVLNIRLC